MPVFLYTVEEYPSMERITYIVKKSRRAKRMCLSVHFDGQIVVTTPPSARMSSVERFVRHEWDWLMRALASLDPVDKRHIRYFSTEDYQRHKEEARAIIMRRLEYLNQYYGFQYNRVFIKNQRTCWGSCSEKKNLNFNYKIMFLPPSIRDYIIVHELCHLKEFNHSPRFWALVGKALFNYMSLRSQLCEYERCFRQVD